MSIQCLQVQLKQVRDGRHGLPVYARYGDSGFDFHAYVEDLVTVAPGHRVFIPTGIAMSVPYGYELQVRPRSGKALKEGITVLNAPGTVDAGYTNEIGVILINHGDLPIIIKDGDKIAQGVLAPVFKAVFELVDDLNETERGLGGFGHSGS